jgi:hypothetical protein
MILELNDAKQKFLKPFYKQIKKKIQIFLTLLNYMCSPILFDQLLLLFTLS